MIFNQLIGKTVLALIPRWHKEKQFSIKILGVENGGIWIESQYVTNEILTALGQSITISTPMLFVPYHEFAYVLSSLAVPGLNETML